MWVGASKEVRACVRECIMSQDGFAQCPVMHAVCASRWCVGARVCQHHSVHALVRACPVCMSIGGFKRDYKASGTHDVPLSQLRSAALVPAAGVLLRPYLVPLGLLVVLGLIWAPWVLCAWGGIRGYPGQ